MTYGTCYENDRTMHTSIFLLPRAIIVIIMINSSVFHRNVKIRRETRCGHATKMRFTFQCLARILGRIFTVNRSEFDEVCLFVHSKIAEDEIRSLFRIEKPRVLLSSGPRCCAAGLPRGTRPDLKLRGVHPPDFREGSVSRRAR